MWIDQRYTEHCVNLPHRARTDVVACLNDAGFLKLEAPRRHATLETRATRAAPATRATREAPLVWHLSQCISLCNTS